MPSQKNIQEVEQIQERIQNSDVVILTDYKGLTVAEINDLRRQLREADVQYKVCKNTLINVVAETLEIKGLDLYLTGPTAIAASNDPKASARILRDFGRTHVHLQIKGGILGMQVIDAAGVEALINMPSREELLARAIGGIKAPLSGLINALHNGSPVTRLVNVLNGTIRQVTTVLQAIADQKKEAEQA